jgi:hypothetical protein
VGGRHKVGSYNMRLGRTALLSALATGTKLLSSFLLAKIALVFGGLSLCRVSDS